jgi:hypothetical protein
MKNFFVLLFVFFFGFSSNSQFKKEGYYKYIIVPQTLEFFKEADQYKTSSLTKFLLEKNGFTVFLDSEKYPGDLRENICSALTAKLIHGSSMFKTVIRIVLKDCFNNEVYSSEEGVSRLKVYEESYHEAIRNAHLSMVDLKYKPKVNLEFKGLVNKHSGKDSYKVKDTLLVVPSEEKTLPSKDTILGIQQLYAQPIANGFQLVDAKPEIIFLILETSRKDFFILKGHQGILYRDRSQWIAEYYESGMLLSKKYFIKF